MWRRVSSSGSWSPVDGGPWTGRAGEGCGTVGVRVTGLGDQHEGHGHVGRQFCFLLNPERMLGVLCPESPIGRALSSLRLPDLTR